MITVYLSGEYCPTGETWQIELEDRVANDSSHTYNVQTDSRIPISVAISAAGYGDVIYRNLTNGEVNWTEKALLSDGDEIKP